MVDVIVVGGGIFGRTITKHLHDLGHDVACIDAMKQFSGSWPSACLMKPSWFAGLGKGIYEPALMTLDAAWGLHDLDFTVGFGTKRGLFQTTVHWVDRAKVFAAEEQEWMHWGEVLSVHEDGHVVVRQANEIHEMEARHIVVAAGVWTKHLQDVPGLHAQFGAACLWSGQLESNFIKPWAPYRQLVAFNIDDRSTWTGDGSAIVEHRWRPECEDKIVARCRSAVNGGGMPEVRVGMRPYIRGVKHALLERRSPKVWVATGGAKNGTLGAGWCAHRLGRALA